MFVSVSGGDKRKYINDGRAGPDHGAKNGLPRGVPYYYINLEHSDAQVV